MGGVRKNFALGCLIIIAGLLAVPVGWFLIFCAWPQWRYDRLQDSMLLPENYKPAELMLARMCQSDPSIFAHELDEGYTGGPPACVPIELGKFGYDLTIGPDDGRIDGGGGFIDGYGYEVVRDKDASDAKQNTWVMKFNAPGPARGTGQDLDRFSIAKSDQLTETELVKNALTEIEAMKDRSKLFTAGIDPEHQRKLLLFRHPDVAKQLGMEVPSAAATQPGATQ